MLTDNDPHGRRNENAAPNDEKTPYSYINYIVTAPSLCKDDKDQRIRETRLAGYTPPPKPCTFTASILIISGLSFSPNTGIIAVLVSFSSS